MLVLAKGQFARLLLMFCPRYSNIPLWRKCRQIRGKIDSYLTNLNLGHVWMDKFPSFWERSQIVNDNHILIIVRMMIAYRYMRILCTYTQ